jgi:mono/diheme cytochrome c family protein
MKLNAVGAALTLSVFLTACGPSGGDTVKRGQYLVAVAACGECHTPGALLGKPEMDKVYSGGTVGLQIPDLGTFFPPNLTPDEKTGLGKWSEAEIATAIRTGVRPDGRQIAPVMPYGWYAKLTEEDALAMAVYLKSLAPISHKVLGPFGPSETPTGPYQPTVFPPAAPEAQPATPATTPP